MSNYVICKDRKKLKLARYNYNWAGNKFSYEFGTSSRIWTVTDELDFEIIADLMFNSKQVLWTETYPENNVLSVKFRESKEVLTEETIKSMKGYKKFFGYQNIKKLEIA